jgi:hypothetical protein
MVMVCDCRISTLNDEFPTLKFNVGVGKKPVNLSIKPSSYMIYNKNVASTEQQRCTVSFTPNLEKGTRGLAWSFGNTFNRAIFSVYHVGNMYSKICIISG